MLNILLKIKHSKISNYEIAHSSGLATAEYFMLLYALEKPNKRKKTQDKMIALAQGYCKITGIEYSEEVFNNLYSYV